MEKKILALKLFIYKKNIDIFLFYHKNDMGGNEGVQVASGKWSFVPKNQLELKLVYGFLYLLCALATRNKKYS